MDELYSRPTICEPIVKELIVCGTNRAELSTHPGQLPSAQVSPDSHLVADSYDCIATPGGVYI